MERLNRLMLLLLFITMYTSCASAQQLAVFTHGDSWSAAPVQSIVKIKVEQPPILSVFFKDRMVSVTAETTYWNHSVPDTLYLHFLNDSVIVNNPRLDLIQTITNHADVTVTSTGNRPFVCKATGGSSNGRLVIDSDTTFTLVLAGLDLTSQKASAISLTQKQKVRIVLADGTTNTLSDAATYQTDNSDTSNGCLYAKGSVTFTGSGTLSVTGNSKHAISSSKNITIENGHIIINNAVKDGLHSDKFQMKGGTLSLSLSHDGSKGVKCKEDFTMTGGRIEGEATGDVIIKDGETTYCSLLKCGGAMKVAYGDISLKHNGRGGRCISVDGNLHIAGGTLELETTGDGGRYLTVDNETDYYTPKCITADDSLLITGGSIHCLSTGLGGKGLVADKYLAIGSEGEQEGPFIRVETTGECIVNDEDEDKRFGCPKGIKADSTLIIFSGNIAVHTAGMGGEGVECNGNMLIHGGTLECITFDDGINVGRSIETTGGQVYCNSSDNDGIDSNGSITISGGIVASVNQKRPNESFDAESGQIYFKGGTVFGIGSNPVEVKESIYPYYSTPYNMSEEGPRSKGLILTEGKYVSLQKGGVLMMALYNNNQEFRSFVTIMSPSLTEQGNYTIGELDTFSNSQCKYFNDMLIIGGDIVISFPIIEIQVQTTKNN